ncbi:hypothetical protein SO802_026639 [Lithocarpus litseifolius]|uniref:GRF-type domain-containing protein n=1 Tax=Lithocarpus litseifolius TaxID=425828 RepID=A0AAW2C3U3_9ROSI
MLGTQWFLMKIDGKTDENCRKIDLIRGFFSVDLQTLLEFLSLQWFFNLQGIVGSLNLGMFSSWFMEVETFGWIAFRISLNSDRLLKESPKSQSLLDHPFSSLRAKDETLFQSSAPSTPQKIHGVKIALIGSHLHCPHSKTQHLFAAPFVAADPSLEYPRPVLIAVDASEDPRLGFALIGSHLHCPHSKTQQLIQLLSPPTHHPNIQMSDAMHDDIDDGLRFQNSNCFCGMRAIVRISDKRNENRYRLFQCCPKDACRFFQWCIPLKTPLSYAEDFQQLQEELCVLREELRVVHDKVHLLEQTKKMVKIIFIGWCLLCTTLALLLIVIMT